MLSNVAPKHIKSQSAMEYLMTYGWAILIIAIVLAALFSLGVFSPTAYTPKASPGSCQVFRPNGPGTTSFINLEGICNGELPRYVASFGPTQSYINISSPNNFSNLNTITFSFWFKSSVPWTNTYWPGSVIFVSKWTPGPCSSDWGSLGGSESGGNNEGRIVVGFGTSVCASAGSGVRLYSQQGLNNGVWHNVVATRTPGGTDYLYIDGILVASESDPGGTITNNRDIQLGIDNYPPNGGPYSQLTGNIANFQLYNTSLSANDIKALYQEGIGGAPINIENLVGWWPLNGNANDYSGNDNNGVPNGVTYTSSWYSGYSTP